MIRFVDMRAADVAGGRFAFFDTVRDRFVQKAGEHAWDTWADFEGSSASVAEPTGTNPRSARVTRPRLCLP